MSQNSHKRLAKWAKANITPEVSEVIHQGALPLVHPAHHKFRGENQHEFNNIYVRKYTPDPRKAQLA
jgi:hypothetical protein